MPQEVQIPQAVGEQPQQQAPGPGNLRAAATAQPAQLTAEEKLEVNLKFKLFSYLQISSSGRLYPHSLATLAVLLCCIIVVVFFFFSPVVSLGTFWVFSFPTRVLNCYVAEWLFYYYSSWSWQVNYALAFCPLFRLFS